MTPSHGESLKVIGGPDAFLDDLTGMVYLLLFVK